MGRYLGPKHKLCRRVGEKICSNDKCPVSRRPYKPGVHGPTSRTRLTGYGIQLIEKQKAKKISYEDTPDDRQPMAPAEPPGIPYNPDDEAERAKFNAAIMTELDRYAKSILQKGKIFTDATGFKTRDEAWQQKANLDELIAKIRSYAGG